MTKCATGLGVFVLAIGLISACGGTVLRDGDGSGGSTMTAGAGNGGATASGGASASGAATSSGGASASDACSGPLDSGTCDGYFPSFWHDPNSGLCEPFIYGGCGAKSAANRYETREACIAACGAKGQDWAGCQGDEECTLISPGCCGGCEPIAGSSLLAINASHTQDFQNQNCKEAVPCAACMPTGELGETGKYFKAVCVSGQCSALDIRTTAITACKENSDCELRNGTGCCQGCAQSGFVAVNKQADLCDGASGPCGLCISLPPPSLVAECQQGVCALSELIAE